MSKRSARALTAAGCFVALSLATGPSSRAQDVGVDDPTVVIGLAERRGQSALSRGAYAEALEQFAWGLAAARQSGNLEAEVRFLFFSGLSNQEQAALQPQGELARQRLKEAAEQYSQALSLLPEAGGTLNNLARVFEELGEEERALKLYNQAVALEDANQAIYARNLADLLARRGDTTGAARAYRLVSRLQPDEVEVKRSLIAAYLDTGSPELLPYLWELLERGDAVRARGGSLAALETGHRFAQFQSELLAILASALARESYDPREFLGSETGRRLHALVERPFIGRAVREILALHEGPERSAGAQWWAREGEVERDPNRGVWPRDAYRALTGSLGEWYRRARDIRTAKAYFEHQARFIPEEVDPKALQSLTRLYLDQGQLDSVASLTRRYEDILFAGKGIAYRASQDRRIYEYHRTLGELYGVLGVWGSRGDVRSAIFQLEKARETASRLDEAPAADTTRAELLFPPELAELLARAYLAAGDTAASYRTRVEAAERYQKGGEASSAGRLIAPIAEPEKLEPRDRRLYERLKVAVPPRSLLPAEGVELRALPPR